MTLEELESTWATLTIPSLPDSVNGRRATGMSRERTVYLAVDGHSHRHLLVQVSDSTKPITQRETRGLDITTSRFEVGTNPEALYVDLVCTDSHYHPIFCAVAQDLLRSLRIAQTSPRDIIVDALARWRAFWSNQGDGMSWEEALGLFGELWFLSRWLAPVDTDIITRWQATDGARHDFQWMEASVEVKTAATGHSVDPIHRITGLEQLADAEQGQLYFFSLHVSDDALAGNTLHSLVNGLVDELQDNYPALAAFNEKLAARRYTPADRHAAARPLRILSERLYRVSDGFPRIIRSSFWPELPTGIVDIGYMIDLAVCRPWLVALSPADAVVPALR